MKNKTKIITTIAAIIIIAALIITLLPNKQDKETINIGVLIPLNGRTATWGEALLDSIELATEEINNEGDIKINLIIEDSKCDPTTAVSAANKLININEVQAIIGGACSSVVLAVAPIAEENEVVFLTPIAQSSAITNAGDYTFRLSISSAEASKFLAEKVYDDGNKRVATLTVQNSYGEDLQINFENAFENLGGEIVQSEKYLSTETDFSTSLTLIKNSEPDALISFITIEGTSIAQKYEELGLNVPLYGSSTWGSKPNNAGVEEIIDGLIYPLNKADKTNIKYMEFEKAFEDKYEKAPTISWINANSYDAMNSLAKAIETEGTSGKSIKNGLYKIEINGASGIVNFNSNGDSFTEMQLMIFRNGSSRPL